MAWCISSVIRGSSRETPRLCADIPAWPVHSLVFGSGRIGKKVVMSISTLASSISAVISFFINVGTVAVWFVVRA